MTNHGGAVRQYCKTLLILLALHLAWLPTDAWAQSDELESGFKRVTPEEEKQLRAVLAEPVPKSSGLGEHFQAKRNAAERLGDHDLRVSLYRQWIAALPDELGPKNQLANMLSADGQFDEAIQLRRELVAASKFDDDSVFYREKLASALFGASRYEEAQKINDQVLAKVESLSGRSRSRLVSTKSNALELDSALHRAYGRYDQAIQVASQALKLAREALKSRKAGTARDEKNTRVMVSDVASNMGTLTAAYRDAGRFADAEAVLKDYVRFSQKEELPPAYLSGLNRISGGLRFDQREFAEAQRYFTKADQVLESLGYGPLSRGRLGLRQNLISCLEGQRQWDAALKELRALDALAGDDPALKKRVTMTFERGYAFLGARQNLGEASRLFARYLQSVSQRYPDQHFFVAQAKGLLGVSIWRQANPASQGRATVLLREAVVAYMQPDNVAFETLNVRKDIRDLIFATYLEAVFATPSESPMDAMAPADWVRGGMVQEALADAAVRSAAATPALADLVRQDQDSKNEIEALRKFLAGDVESPSADLPEISAKMRDRIVELETLRGRLRGKLKAQFPDYDTLVRPKLPTVADLRDALQQDEALLVLLPVDNAVYVWALDKSTGQAHARVALPKAELLKTIQALRASLDFIEMGSGLVPFRADLSSDLYQRLIAPVAGVLQGKAHLMIAAGGALGQLPFGVFLTSPVTRLDAQSPWLIRQAAITHIPSLSAWLAVEKFARAQSAPQALAAWGDPLFGAEVQGTTVQPAGTRHLNIKRSATVMDLEKEGPASAFRYADIPALPDTRDELVAIAAALQADRERDLHLGAQATKASVLASNRTGELRSKKVIAFATHGLMAGDLPTLEQPALALAATGDEDKNPLGALLTLDEVLGLKLNADWVVLSACNTAAADGRGDEALSGLARGFFYAGSRSLLVTHWSVESDSARLLTTSTMAYYMANPKERKAESLRQAMLAVMKNPQYQHPAYWAPYALVGDGGR